MLSIEIVAQQFFVGRTQFVLPVVLAPGAPKKPTDRYAVPYRRGTWHHAVTYGKLIYAQVPEVGRQSNGAVEPDRKRGPKFRAPYSGYGLS